jgi:hemerythrin-like domain-containing protein
MQSRRAFLYLSTGSAAGALVSACNRAGSPGLAAGVASPQGGKEQGGKEIEVTAVEDLMREHGVLRRCLIIYREVAAKLRTRGAIVAPDALGKTAKLFRSFGEEYHEKKLEEEHIFPAVKRAGGLPATYVDALLVQHQRGREITEYVLSMTGGTKIAADAEPLANALQSFARMYEVHAAREDTVVFPAWKRTMSPKEYDAAGDRFEDIEHQQFGKDGFDDAVQQMAGIEEELGLADLAALTAPPPPKAY